MTGSSTIFQTLLPGKSGDVAQRGASLRKNEQSFASVYEKRIQVRQDKAEFPRPTSDVADKRQAVNEQREDDRAVEKAKKAEKPLFKNPAKEKMKELMKKIKDTLDDMKEVGNSSDDPTTRAEMLKALAEDLKNTLSEIRTLIENQESQLPKAEAMKTDDQGILKMIESMTAVNPTQADQPTLTEKTGGEGLEAGTAEGIDKTEHWNNRQAPELKGNPILKDLEKVIETQADLIANDPDLKEELKQILTDIKAIQDIKVTKPEAQFTEKLDDLMNKLNGIVIKAPEVKETESKTESEAGSVVEASESAERLTASPVTADAGTTNQQDDSTQSDQTPDKQAYNAETPAETKDAKASDQTKTSTDKPAAAVEKSMSAAPKAMVPETAQPTQNPQAFQDTLDAVKESVQAKTQFQSRIMEQVVESFKMNFKADDGKSEMVMKLKPESLGNVALKVSIDKGIVLAQFQVESQAVKQALEANLQDLRTALQDKGFNVFTLDVSVRKDNQQQQNESSGNGFRNRTPRMEATVERLEQRLMSLESVHRESTIDYLG